jgi:Na+-transporting methylmalonyl-CoA/oxaloacetate decarboxylase gamma subunit
MIKNTTIDGAVFIFCSILAFLTLLLSDSIVSSITLLLTAQWLIGKMVHRRQKLAMPGEPNTENFSRFESAKQQAVDSLNQLKLTP